MGGLLVDQHGPTGLHILHILHSLHIDWNSWSLPPLFELIQRTGKISDEEMRHVFNLGIGMILVVDKNNVDYILNKTSHLNGKIVGEIS